MVAEDVERLDAQGGPESADGGFAVADSSGLTDADWAEANKLQRAFSDGGQPALLQALEELGSDPVRYIRVVSAFFPDMVRETIQEEMAESRMTEKNLRELVRKLARPALDQ